MTSATGEAPGKILLIGEHAVVYGHPAIAIPLRGLATRAEVTLTRDSVIDFEAVNLNEHVQNVEGASNRLAPLVRLADSIRRLFGEEQQGLTVRLESSIPIGRGLGSGAAAAVALVNGICGALGRKLDNDQISELAMEAEREFHGVPSGVDCAVIARNEAVYFVKGKPPQPIACGRNGFHFLVADTGIESSTSAVVAEIRDARERERARVDSLFWELGSMATVAREIIRNGTPAELGACMSHAHGILQNLGVSCEELDRLMETALEKGALGAKLSGAGRGGVAIALIDETVDVAALTAELKLAGAENVYSTHLEAAS